MAVKKVKVSVARLLGVLLFIVLSQTTVLAHYPPSANQQDCGLISGDLFYSEYYSPPQGTPASVGTCSWVKTSNTVCAVRNFNGTNYNLYPYRFICNMPLDTNAYACVLALGFFGFFRIRLSKKIEEGGGIS